MRGDKREVVGGRIGKEPERWMHAYIDAGKR